MIEIFKSSDEQNFYYRNTEGTESVVKLFLHGPNMLIAIKRTPNWNLRNFVMPTPREWQTEIELAGMRYELYRYV